MEGEECERREVRRRDREERMGKQKKGVQRVREKPSTRVTIVSLPSTRK